MKKEREHFKIVKNAHFHGRDSSSLYVKLK